MYISKVLKDKILKNVQFYNNYENALSDVINGDNELYHNLDTSNIDFSKPNIVSGGTNNLGFDCDFEFRYPNGITVCIGAPLIEDEKEYR